MMEEFAAVVVHVHPARETDLTLIGQAGDTLGVFAGAGERRQQDGNQSGDDCDDDQQFNQREGVARPSGPGVHVRSPVVAGRSVGV